MINFMLGVAVGWFGSELLDGVKEKIKERINAKFDAWWPKK
jgi:hypothetical protein